MPAEPTAARPLLEMCNIGKSFLGVRALQGVTFDLYPGEIHALIGENGAGKSTLIRILGGVYSYPHYDGEVRIDDAVQRFRNVHDSERAGISVVFQELSLVPEMTVAENLFLGREPQRLGIVRWDALYAQARALLEELQIEIDTKIPVARLGVGQQQLVEIAKALSCTARILVLDEPTAALTDAEAENLFSVLDRLRGHGVGVIYISHRLQEVFRTSDRITVLRDGRSVGTKATSEVEAKRVIAMMVGREVNQLFPAAGRAGGGVALEVRHVTAQDAEMSGRLVVQDVSFQVRRGEVLGIAGLMGSGRTELLMSVFGAHPGRVTGQIVVSGKVVQIRRPADAIANGIALVTEDRKRYGLFFEQTVLRNMTMSALRRISGSFITDEAREFAVSTPLFERLRIKANSLSSAVGTLSGGNQQKVVLARCLLTEPRILFLDEPTRGIDVGAKQEIYFEIDRLAQSGLALVIISSELPEVLGLSDRVIVLHKGKVTGEFTRENVTPEALMACATGHTVEATSAIPRMVD